MNLPLIASVVIHIVFLLIVSVSFNNPFRNTGKIEDKGFAVFEFKQVAPKSAAPVLSDKEGHVAKEKAQKADKEEGKHTQNTESIKEKVEAKKRKEVVVKDKKKTENKKKKKPDKPVKAKKVAPKEVNKKSDKAVVNLKKNKGSVSSVGKKKAFDSLLDDAAAGLENGENTGVKAEEVGLVLTASQIDLIRQTIRKCWHFPAGLKNANELLVDIKMELSEDGTVKKAEIVDKARMKRDSAFKIAAENAYRAVLDPECNPLPLPKEKYNEWKDLELTFNPKEMFE
jgi:outer membrane biosynthesis protein TonB